jgi:hypothetical protein
VRRFDEIGELEGLFELECRMMQVYLGMDLVGFNRKVMLGKSVGGVYTEEKGDERKIADDERVHIVERGRECYLIDLETGESRRTMWCEMREEMMREKGLKVVNLDFLEVSNTTTIY